MTQATTAVCYYIIHGPQKGALSQNIQKALASVLEPGGGRTHFHGTQAPPPKSESSTSKIFRHSGMTLVFKYHV
jgi:hypothetical protein